jgi:hypothetical protein
VRGSNPRPYACKAYALPAELTAQKAISGAYHAVHIQIRFLQKLSIANGFLTDNS